MTADRYWLRSPSAQDADLNVHIRRRMETEVARVGPGVNGRWWVLMEPRRDETPPHGHGIEGYHADPDHPARCRSPRCWTKPVLTIDGQVGYLPDPRK